ncbi:MAG: TAXI family TRAP transporter solute-binding subunit [Mailhella sp.]|nr:TAXI family TRAP transporter solute-binding subunit [Mailhella sp.]
MTSILKKAFLAAALIACTAITSEAADSLRIVSAANPSGTWYIGMGAIGKVYSKMTGADVTMLPGGGATNAPRLASRDADLGVAENSILTAFKNGTEPYKKPTKEGVAAIINLQDRINYQIVSPIASPVKDLRDLKTMKNLKIGVGSTGGSTEKIFRNLLKEYGITYDDIKKNGGTIVTNSFDDIANMCKDGNIDVFVWIGPGEAWFIVDVSGSVPLKWLSIDPAIAEKAAAKLGTHVGTLPAELYKGKVGPNITTFWDTNAIVVRDNMNDETAYALTKAIVEGKEDIARANPSWKSIDATTGWDGNVFPLHPGAAKYYKEKGFMK